MEFHLKIAALTDMGRHRKNNEDFFYVDHHLGLMIVADGMGGHNAGEVASQLATEICSHQLKRSLVSGHVPVFIHVPPSDELDVRSLILGDCFKFSNTQVHEAAQARPENQNMGTTMVGALFLDDRLAVANVGDSRLYRFRNGDLTQITVDHSFVQDQLLKGLIRPEDAEKSHMKNMLTRSIGTNADVDVDVMEIDLKNNDVILLCSDGLTKMLSDDEIAKIISKEKDPNKITQKLVSEANKKGGDDNITVVVAAVLAGKEKGLPWGDRIKRLFNKNREGKQSNAETHS